MMRVKSKSSICFVMWISLVILVGGTAPSWAYVPTSAQIIDQYLKTLGKAKSLEVHEKLVYFDTRIADGTAEFDETVKYVFPDRFRSDIRTRTTTKTMVVTFDKSLVLLDGKIAAEHEGGLDHYKDILLFRNRVMASARLESLGIDLSQTWLDRFEGHIVFVIGARDDDPLTPRLYVDKQTFLPIRLLLKGTSSGENPDLYEILFFEWKVFGKTKFPSRIELYRNHTLAREIKVETITPGLTFDEALFDVDALKAKSAEKESHNRVLPDSGPDGDVKKTINDLDKIIEKDQLAF